MKILGQRRHRRQRNEYMIVISEPASKWNSSLIEKRTTKNSDVSNYYSNRHL